MDATAQPPQNHALPPLLDRFQESRTAASSSSPDGGTPPPRPLHPQDASPFFARLPGEIRRMIYVELWRTFGCTYDDDEEEEEEPHPARDYGGGGWESSGGGNLSPHIVKDFDDRFASAPCCLVGGHRSEATDAVSPSSSSSSVPLPAEAFDDRAARLAAARRHAAAAANLADLVADGESAVDVAAAAASVRRWRARVQSPWQAHWPCEEYYSGSSGDASDASGARTQAGAASEARMTKRRPPLRRPYLPVLLTCQRAYAEGIALLYSALTFQFTDAGTARAFLARWPCVASVRVLAEFAPSLLDAYRRAAGDRGERIVVGGWGRAPQGDAGAAPGGGGGGDSNAATAGGDGVAPGGGGDSSAAAAAAAGGGGAAAAASPAAASPAVRRHNAWGDLAALLGSPDRLPNLRRLHVWAESHDLRAWHACAAETRLFAPLAAATHLGKGGGPSDQFVIYLPALPADKAARALPGCYLEEEEEEEEEEEGSNGNEDQPRRPRRRLPCTIVRTERPDNWGLYFNMRRPLAGLPLPPLPPQPVLAPAPM